VASVPAASSVCSGLAEVDAEEEADDDPTSEVAGAEEEDDSDSTATATGEVADGAESVPLLETESDADTDADADSIEELVEAAAVVGPEFEAAFKALMTKSAPRSCITLLP
jgi:hypothetical protein